MPVEGRCRREFAAKHREINGERRKPRSARIDNHRARIDSSRDTWVLKP